MSQLKRVVSLVSIMLALSACAPGSRQFPIATFEGGRFQHVGYDYGVVAQGGTGELMSSDWRLDNYGPATQSGLGLPKATALYVSEVGLDNDGDGVYERRATVPNYDLLFEHRRDDGRIFLSTVPVSQHASQRDLSVMLRNLVESAAAIGEVTHHFSDGASQVAAPMASRILASRSAVVHGFPAHEVVFEVANVQQLELTPSARWERGHVVLVRANLVFARLEHSRTARLQPLAHQVVEGTFYPVLMLIGYANHPDEFDAHHEEFRDFVNRVRIGDGWDIGGIEATRAACDIDRLDVAVDDGEVIMTSLSLDSDEMRCAQDALRAVVLPESPWMRTFSLLARPLRSGTSTTAGEPIHRGAEAAATVGGENPIVPPAEAELESAP